MAMAVAKTATINVKCPPQLSFYGRSGGGHGGSSEVGLLLLILLLDL